MAKLTKELIEKEKHGKELIDYINENKYDNMMNNDYFHLIDGQQVDDEFNLIYDLSNGFTINEFEDELEHWKIIGIQWSEDSYLVVFRKLLNDVKMTKNNL